MGYFNGFVIIYAEECPSTRREINEATVHGKINNLVEIRIVRPRARGNGTINAGWKL